MPDELAVLVKAMLTGLAMQRRLEPDSVTDDLRSARPVRAAGTSRVIHLAATPVGLGVAPGAPLRTPTPS